MPTTLWSMPTPSANLGHGMELEKNDREGWYQLSVTYLEGEQEIRVCLAFHGVAALKATFYHACTLEMIQWSYDKLVDVGRSGWLDEIAREIVSRDGVAPALKHLMIYFDDGPCFEFLCESHSVTTDARARVSTTRL